MNQSIQLRTSDANAAVLAAAGETGQYLTFTLANELFAVGILHVKEIIEYGSLTEIPMMPGCIRGVINLRGAVVPVIDLAARFGGHSSSVQRRTCIVIVELQQDEGKQDIGIMVDAVSEVLEIPANDIEPPPAFGARIRADFIAGMGKTSRASASNATAGADSKFVIILNIQNVLSIEEMASLTAIETNGPSETT